MNTSNSSVIASDIATSLLDTACEAPYDATLSLCLDRARLACHFIDNGPTVSSRLNGLDFLRAAGQYAEYLTFDEMCDIIDEALSYGTFTAAK